LFFFFFKVTNQPRNPSSLGMFLDHPRVPVFVWLSHDGRTGYDNLLSRPRSAVRRDNPLERFPTVFPSSARRPPASPHYVAAPFYLVVFPLYGHESHLDLSLTSCVLGTGSDIPNKPPSMAHNPFSVIACYGNNAPPSMTLTPNAAIFLPGYPLKFTFPSLWSKPIPLER